MSLIPSDYELALERISNALPCTELEAALNDDVVVAGIVSPENSGGLVGSRLFNVATAIMQRLRLTPEEPVVGRPIKIPENAKRLARLSRFSMQLCNDSLIRQKQRNKELGYRSQYVAVPPGSPLSPQVETALLRSLSDEPDDMSELNKIYARENGKPAFVQNELSGPGVTLNLERININGVRYPAGTLFALHENILAPHTVRQGFRIMSVHQPHLESIAALRLSAFALPLEERPYAFDPIASHAHELSLLQSEAIQKQSLPDLIGLLPDRDTLEAAVQELK